MKNKTIYIIIGIVVVILAFFVGAKSSKAPLVSTENTGTQNQSAASSTITNTASPKTSSSSKTGKILSIPSSASAKTAANVPIFDLIDQRIVFPLQDFPNVKATVTQVAFGRKEAIVSPKCNGIPNNYFSTYLYPGDDLCINTFKVDGIPGGLMAFHILIENNDKIGFGGISNIFQLQYLGRDSAGKPVNKFATPIIDMANYYIKPYSSQEVVLSYMVPENQLLYNFLLGYKAPDLGNTDLNIYDFAASGFSVDFGIKSIKIVK